MKSLVSGVVIVFGLALAAQAYAVDLDPALPPYKAKSLGDATIKSVGSDTLGELMKSLGRRFHEAEPEREDTNREQRFRHRPCRTSRRNVTARTDVAPHAIRGI